MPTPRWDPRLCQHCKKPAFRKRNSTDRGWNRGPPQLRSAKERERLFGITPSKETWAFSTETGYSQAKRGGHGERGGPFLFVWVEFRQQAQQLPKSLAALFPKGTRFPEQPFPPRTL